MLTPPPTRLQLALHHLLLRIWIGRGTAQCDSRRPPPFARCLSLQVQRQLSQELELSLLSAPSRVDSTSRFFNCIPSACAAYSREA